MVLLRVSLFFTACFALLIALPRISTYDPVPALTACAVPCWQGLEVQATPRDQALAVMTSIHGFEPWFAPCYDTGGESCALYQWKFMEDAVTESVIEVRRGKLYMILDKPAHLMLGEVLLALDRLDLPLYEYRVNVSSDLVYTSSKTLHLELIFSDVNINVGVDLGCPVTYFTLMHTHIMSIAINPPVPVAHTLTPFRSVRHSMYRQCER